jgi:putative pyrroloquinoline-quinone binding quinoprotein
VRRFPSAAVAAVALVACTSSTQTSTAAPSSSSHSAAVATGAAPAATTAKYAPWPTYHGNRTRTGVATTMPAFTGHLAVRWKKSLDGAVYGSPLVVGNYVIVATENDTVYAFSIGGTLLWSKHLGTPSPPDQHPCPGNIQPRGITGTPVYYLGKVYVVTEYSGHPPRHEMVALHVGTGGVAWHRTVDFPGVDQSAMQQRSALTIEGGRVWTTFGGIAGDCGNYKGRIISIRADGTGSHFQWTVPTSREAGMWTPPGPAVDSQGYVYVSAGNGAAGAGDEYDLSDSVLKFDVNLHLHSYFAPSTWQADNDADLDLGSQGPALVGNYVFIDGKRGTAYTLHRSALGGIGGQVSSHTVCASFGGTAVNGSAVYVPCSDGVRRVTVSSSGSMTVNWHASPSGSPVVGAGRVWSVDQGAGVLHALSPSTGVSTAQISVGTTSRFATPALYGRLILVPTLTGITVVIES